VDLGGTVTVEGFCLSYFGPFENLEPNRTVTGVNIFVLDESCGEVLTTVRPSVNSYPGVSQPIGTPDVWTTFGTDLYVGIAGGTQERILLNVFVFPFQWLLWFGGLIIVAGGALAMFRKPGSATQRSNRSAEADATSSGPTRD
jgi:cytochrome c biogenesis factor